MVLVRVLSPPFEQDITPFFEQAGKSCGQCRLYGTESENKKELPVGIRQLFFQQRFILFFQRIADFLIDLPDTAFVNFDDFPVVSDQPVDFYFDVGCLGVNSS
jgi:hypothetical protein